MLRRAWADSTRFGWKKASGAMLALVVDAALRAKAGVQAPEIALKALAVGIVGYVLLAVLEYGWNVLKVPHTMDAEQSADAARLRGEIEKHTKPPTEGITRLQDRLRGWIADRGDASAARSLMWLTDVVPAGHALSHYVEPLQELAKQMGDALIVRETTKNAEGTITDVQFKVKRWW